MGENKKIQSRRQRKRQRDSEVVKGGACAFGIWATAPDEWEVKLEVPPSLIADEDLALVFLVEAAPRIRIAMLEVVNRDSCICSTKIMVGLARALGLSAEPLSVHVKVTNPVMTQAMEKRAWDWGMTEGEVRVLNEAGGRILIAGAKNAPPEEGRWNGHLVALLAGEILIDLSFDQFHRPEKKIPVIAPLVLPWDDQGMSATRGDGVAAIFSKAPDAGYQSSPDWKRSYKIVVNGVESVI